MKQFFTLTLGMAFVALISIQASAQTPRMGFVEEATQASCPPCAALNPGLQALVNANSDKVIFMGYQVWWPGFDQMYLDNQADVDDRVGSYYGFGWAPQVVFQGSLAPGASDPGTVSNFTQANIDDNYATMSEFDVVIDAEVVNGEIVISGSVTGTMAASGDFKLHLVLTEGTIYSTQATGGTNGETEYHHVMKKFLPGTSGIELASTWASGDTYTIDQTFPLGGLTIYNWDDLEVIAFVQNDDDKFVHQVTKDSDVGILVDAANNASAGDISGTPGVICPGPQTLSPVFTLINGGNELLTSADIVYSANGSTPQMYSWTGSLETFASEEVTVDPISFTASAMDPSVLDFSVENPNGVADEVGTDNSSSLSIDPAPSSEVTVELTINTDGYGDEIYWEIRTASGIVASGGNPNVGLDNVGTGNFPPPADAASYGNNQTVVEEVTIPSGSDCYTFHITDYYGDGLLGAGNYFLRDNVGNTMHDDGDDYQTEAIKNFSATGAVGLSENELASAITIGPNPTSNMLNVRINLDTKESVVLEMTNALGQKVYTESLGTVSSASLTEINVSGFEAGIYYVNVIAGNATSTSKVTVIK